METKIINKKRYQLNLINIKFMLKEGLVIQAYEEIQKILIDMEKEETL